MLNQFAKIFVIACLFFFAHASAAQSAVVVIPLFGDDPTPLQNIITVSPSGGDFTDPVAAINSIPIAGDDVPASDNPYLIVIGPGEYLLTEQLVMRQHVAMTGSGSLSTRLVGAVSAAAINSTAALVVGANNSPLSQLSIINNATIDNATISGHAIGIYTASSSLNLSHVNVQVDTSDADAIGLYNGFVGGDISDLRVIVTSDNGSVTGISNNSSPLYFNDIFVQVYTPVDLSVAVSNFFSAVRMRRAELMASGGSVSAIGIRNEDGGSGFVNQLSDSRIIVTANPTTTFAYGITNEGSSPDIDNVKIQISDSVNAVGIRSLGDSTPRMSHCSIDVSSATNAWGVINSSSSSMTSLRHCDIEVEGSSTAMGAESNTGNRLRISHSSFKGGSVGGAGNNRCAHSSLVTSGESFIELSSNCFLPIM